MKLEDGPPTDAAVAQGLAALKREGGSVLVVGAPHASHTDICGRFLGEDTERMLVRTDGSVHYETDFSAVVDRPVKTRSAAGAAPSTPVGLDALLSDIRSTMQEVASGESTLRVCFDSLSPFVDSTPAHKLSSFLGSLGETARETGSIVHIHLPAMAGAVPESLLDSVDAVVELTRRGESTYQQWRLPEEGATSDWLSV